MIGWVLALMACSSSQPQLTVLAASSLTEVMADFETAFEREHPGVEVVVSTAGSQTLAAQIRHGVKADVFASADPWTVQALTTEGLVVGPASIAGNTLVIASKNGPVSVDALGKAGPLVVGDDAVPVGKYTASMLASAQGELGASWGAEVQERIVSREPNVRLVLAKVLLGEADAAVVYATDVLAVKGVQSTPIPPKWAPSIEVVHARIASSEQPDLAQEWMALVVSDAGRSILQKRGFTTQ